MRPAPSSSDRARAVREVLGERRTAGGRACPSAALRAGLRAPQATIRPLPTAPSPRRAMAPASTVEPLCGRAGVSALRARIPHAIYANRDAPPARRGMPSSAGRRSAVATGSKRQRFPSPPPHPHRPSPARIRQIHTRSRARSIARDPRSSAGLSPARGMSVRGRSSRSARSPVAGIVNCVDQVEHSAALSPIAGTCPLSKISILIAWRAPDAGRGHRATGHRSYTFVADETEVVEPAHSRTPALVPPDLRPHETRTHPPGCVLAA